MFRRKRPAKEEDNMTARKSVFSRNILNEHILKDIVKRIVEAVHPQRIILFGSAARGGIGPDSDLDVLVVMPDGTHRRKTAQTIYRSLSGLGIAKDIVVVTETDVQQYGNSPSLVLYPVLRQGKELYHADR
jgi:predicted nucleotidyltransferase